MRDAKLFWEFSPGSDTGTDAWPIRECNCGWRAEV
jgi:hypothetical protein